MTEQERMALGRYVSELGGSMVAITETPKELVPFSAFIPDSGYCVFVIPEVLKDKPEKELFSTSVPVPVMYVIERGWRIENGRVYCNVPYSDEIGADVPEVYCVYERQPERDVSFYTIEEGKVFAPIAGHPEGAYFLYGSDEATVIVNYVAPEPDEIAQMRAGQRLRAGLFVDDGLMSILFKFGTMDWVECPYNPALEQSNLNIAFCDGGRIPLTVFMTDCPSGNVVSKVRVVFLPNEFSFQLRQTMLELLSKPVTGTAYELRLANQRARYGIEDMVKDAVMVVDVVDN